MHEGTPTAGPRPDIIQRKRHGLLHKLKIGWRSRSAVSDVRFGEEALAAFLDGVDGTFPESGESGVVLVACDEAYFWRFGITLLLSIEEQGCATRVHVHLCAPGDRAIARLRELAQKLEIVSLSFTTDDARLAEGLRYRSVYLASARFLIAGTVMERAKAPVLCIDVDAIAVKPIWPALETVRQKADAVLIQRREETSDSRRLRAGAVCFCPTQAGRQYASAVARGIASLFAIRPIYHLDQIVLFYVMRALERRGGFTVADMPPQLSDFDFGGDAVIWMAKGWAMKEAGLYADAKQAVDARHPDMSTTADA